MFLLIEAPIEPSGDRGSMLAEFIELGPDEAPMPRLPVTPVEAKDLLVRAMDALSTAPLGVNRGASGKD